MRRWTRSGHLLHPLLALLLVAGGCADDSSAVPDGEVVDVAAARGLDDASHTQGRNCLIDVDGAESIGLILSTHGNPWPLMVGEPGGTFVERYRFRRRDGHGCAVADFDGDGTQDVYRSVGACEGTCLEAKELWFGQPDGTFVEQGAAWGVDDPAGRGRIPVVFDANGDDRPDLFVGNLVGPGSTNRLWVNRGDHFEALPGPWSEDGVGSFCAAAADVDGDGLDELASCSQESGFFIYGHRDGAFAVVTEELGVEPYGRVSADFGDVDGDGRPDLVTVTRDRVEVLLNEGGRFGRAAFTRDLEDGHDAALADVTGDGDLDLFVVQGGRTDEADLLLLGDGSGRFTTGPDVPRGGGAGDSVTPLPDWQDHRGAFLVNNGYQHAEGARQLLVFRDGD